MNGEILMTIIGGMLGAFSVFGIVMLVLELRKPKRKREPNAYSLSEFDIQALELGKKLLTDVYEVTKDGRRIYFQNGYREYDAYEIPFAVEAIDKLLDKVKQTDKEIGDDDPFELN